MKRIDFRDLQKYLHEIPNQFHSDELLKKIHSMDAHTAYALLGGYLAPLLSAPTKVTIAPKPLHLQTIVSTNVAKVAHGSLKDIKSRITSILPNLEDKLKEILSKLERYKEILPTGKVIDRDGHYRIGSEKENNVYELYEEIFNLVETMRELIKKEGPENWQLHPGLRKKYNEILSLLSAFIQPWEREENRVDPENRGVLPPKETEFLIADIKKALKGLYENREEQEKRSIKELQDRLDELTKNKDEQIADLNKQVQELKRETKDSKISEKDTEIAKLKKQISDLTTEKNTELEKLQKQITDLEKKIKNQEDLEKEIKEVRDQLKVKEKEIKDKKIDEIGKQLPDLQKLLKELEEGGIDLKDLNKLREKIHDLNKLTKDDKDAVKDIGDLQKDIEALRDELNRQKEIELERKQKEKEISDRENKLDELQRKILGLREELKNLESLKGKDLTKFREKLEELEKLKNKVGDSNDKVKALEDEVNQLRRELNKDKREELGKQDKIRKEQEEIERKEREKELEKIREIKLKELKEKQGMMDAYIFMIVVFLTQLHTQQAEKLKAQGETLKKISQIFDQWNKIQSSLNTISQNARTILRWIKERKIDSNYTLYTDATLKKKETDSDKLAIWNKFKSFISDLQQNVKELRRILDQVKRSLPDSATSLLNTMYKLSEKLLDIPDAKGLNDLNSHLKVTDPSEKEKTIEKEITDLKRTDREMEMKINRNVEERIRIKDEVGWFYWNMRDSWLPADKYKLKQRWNELADINEGIYQNRATNAKNIREKEKELRRERREKTALPDKRLTILEWISDSDQTQFKAYMDILAQGVTALTSISNMSQQQLQIDTQYYNSLLGLQKGGMDSLTKSIQGILANMRS